MKSTEVPLSFEKGKETDLPHTHTHTHILLFPGSLPVGITLGHHH